MGREPAVASPMPYHHKVSFDVSITDPKARIQQFQDKWSATPNYHGFDAEVMREHLKLETATAAPTATTTFSMCVPASLCNSMNNLHGGAVSLIFDMCTTMTMAPLSRAGFWEFGGVTRTLGITILRPALLGMDVIVECEVMQAATIRGVMKRKSDGAVLSVAEHGKASVELPASEKL